MKTPKGTRDLLPEETVLFQAIERRALDHFSRYGFREVRTPIFEETALFKRSIGEGTDIVNKEMYTFTDRGGRELTLRPEMTASVCRSVVQHNLVGRDEIVRLLYMGPMFRYERPQAGRFRQFYQLGVEVFGSDDPLIDSETIEALWRFLQPFELPNLNLVINSVGDGNDRPRFLAYLRETLSARESELCADCKVRLHKNILRILDCKVPSCGEIVATLEPISAFLSDENRHHFDRVCEGLSRANIPYSVNPLLVRGLDYYTKTAFELLSGDLGAQSAVMGGGRYDLLVKQLGGPDIPAFGWALGIDRLAGILAKHHKQEMATPDLYFAFGERGWLDDTMPLINRLRQAGHYIAYDLRVGSFKSQMKRANREGAQRVAIVGNDEWQAGTVTLKNMATSEQTTVAMDQLDSHLKEVSHA